MLKTQIASLPLFFLAIAEAIVRTMVVFPEPGSPVKRVTEEGVKPCPPIAESTKSTPVVTVRLRCSGTSMFEIGVPKMRSKFGCNCHFGFPWLEGWLIERIHCFVLTYIMYLILATS